MAQYGGRRWLRLVFRITMYSELWEGHIWSAMTKDQAITTIFINSSKAFDHPGPFRGSRSICAEKIEALWPWLSFSRWFCFIFVNIREQERERGRKW